MLFHRKNKGARTCENGHALEESWEQCPFCTAEAGNGKEDSLPEGGRAAVVVPKGVSRPLAGWIVVLKGEQEGLDFRLVAGRNLIGKGEESDILVKDAQVSERHALFEVRESEGKRKYLLSDLDSKHGTFLNGKSVSEPSVVRDGDTLRFGHTEFKFRSFA